MLTCVHSSHSCVYFCRMVLECLCAHECITADGSKSFILLLAALLRGIRNSVHDSAHVRHRHHAAWKLANQLHAFCMDGLDDVIAHSITPYASYLLRAGGCEQEGRVLAALVGGYVGGRVGVGQAEVLTPLLCEFCTKVGHGDTHSTAISFIHSNFSQLHTAVSGLHSGQSCVVEGLLLACDWSIWKEMDGPMKVLVVFEKLDACYDESVCVQFQKDWTFQSESVMQERLARILRLKASVVLSAVKQPDCVLEWASLNSVTVLECCDPEELDLLCELGEAKTLTVQPLMRVGTLTYCRRFQLGGRRYANFGVTHTSVHTHTLVLCMPAAGPLEQSVSVSQGVFSMLQHLSQSHRHNNISPCPHAQRLTSPQHLTSLQLHSPCPNLLQCILNTGDVIPVGGAFEFLFHHSLLHSNHSDPESRRLLSEAILSVPRCLHAHRTGDFLQHYAHFRRRLLQHRLVREHGSGSEFTWGLGADGSGRVCVEPVCSKHQLVVSVLQCVNRLLRLDTVIHTSRSLALPVLSEPHSEEDDDDDDKDRK